MQIAVVLWSGLYGGAEASSSTLVRHLRARGLDASLVFVGDPGPVGRRALRDSVPTLALGLDRGSLVISRPHRLAEAVGAAGGDGAILVASGYLSGSLRLAGYRARIVSVEHGSVLQERERSLWRWMLRAVDARCSDVGVSVSDRVLREVLRGPHPSQLVRIYPGVDLQHYCPLVNGTNLATGPVEIACASRLVAGKGIDDLLEAIALLGSSTEWRLRIAGDGPERTALEARTQRLAIEDRVSFAGWVEDMPGFWRNADVAVVPSGALPEAFGMVAVEAMACATPVVACENGGLSEIVVDGETGFLVPPRDPASLARAVARLVSDPALRARLADGARRRAESHFSAERTAAEYAGLFAESR